MVKLTAQLIDDSPQIINACRDRELVLRGYKIPVIENLGPTHDQFDTIDFSDNDIKRIENFPSLRRLKALFFSNNRITHVDPSVCESLPSLTTLILTNNCIKEFGDIEPLASFPKLEYLSLLGNPVARKPLYRQFVVFKIPQVRVLDYTRIRKKEREEARKTFKGKKAADWKQIVKMTPLPEVQHQAEAVVNGQRRTSEDIRSIQEAIGRATTVDEVNRLKELLDAGQLPDQQQQQQGPQHVFVAQQQMEVD